MAEDGYPDLSMEKQMANEVSTQQHEVPEWLRKQQAEIPTQDMDALTGLNNKMPRISLRGRKIRLIVEGEEIRKPRDEQEIVILGVEPEKGKMVKTFYEKGYSSGDTEPPTCSSADGIAPDPWVQNPQNALCASCPKNAFGSATSQKGKPAKACKDSKRLWVAVPEDDAELGLGIGRTVFNLGVPVTSLNNLGDYGKHLAKNGYPLSVVKTKLSLEDSEFPILQFEMAGFLEEADGTIAIKRNMEKDWKIGMSSGPALTDESKPKPNMISQTKAPAQDVTDVKETSAQAVAQGAGSGEVNSVLGDWEDK